MGTLFISISAIILAITQICIIHAAITNPCAILQEEKCEQTEYSAYLECVHAQKQIRHKRQANDCPLNENNEESQKPLTDNCQKLNFDCRYACGANNSCVDDCPVCPLNADLVAADYRTIIIESEDGKREIFKARIEADRNITTIIKLTNIINNTNTLHFPTNLTTNNLNNIHIHKQNSTAEDFGLGVTEAGSCCYVVQPKRCYASSTGPRCHHKRHKTCGPQCKSQIIHAQSRKRCNKKGKCDNKVAYVPQPGKPKCIYIEWWPYVACGVEVKHQKKKSCEGCYDHYGYGFENYHDEDEPDCKGCYDDGFDLGPLYRRGPVLRPYYYHQPPCFLTGTCAPYPSPDCGYGCYGGEFVDPAWGDYDESNYEDRPSLNDIPANNTVDSGDSGSGDWEIEVHKCKVLSDDGTIEIRNCTSSDYDDNPYAAEPKIQLNEDNEFEDESDVRYRRHAVHDTEKPSRSVHGKKHLENNYIDDDDDRDYTEENVVNSTANWRRNKIIEDEDEESIEYHPYKRKYNRQHKLHHKRSVHRTRTPKIIYDYEDDLSV